MAPEFDDLYDADTLRRLARGGVRRSESRPVRPRPRVATAALAGALLGLRDVLEDDERHEPVIEIAPDPGAEPVRGVSLFFVPGQPEATVAAVRPFDAIGLDPAS